jgi:hypothetical protein
MKLKDFHEIFKNDFQDRKFVIDYLQDCFEEGGINLFISALKDVVKAYQFFAENQDNILEQNRFLCHFLEHQNPTFTEVYQVLNILELELKIQLLSSTPTVA